MKAAPSTTRIDSNAPAEGAQRSVPARAGARRRRLWQFSVALYKQPQVARACLDLQDRLDLDVNMLLLCAYAGRQGLSLPIKELKRIDASVAAWRELVVQPLRAVRRWLKTDTGQSFDDAASLRQRVLNLELVAERGQQQRMNELLPTARGASDPGIGASNLLRYARMRQRELDPASLRALQSLWVAANPGQDLAATQADWSLAVAAAPRTRAR